MDLPVKRDEESAKLRGCSGSKPLVEDITIQMPAREGQVTLVTPFSHLPPLHNLLHSNSADLLCKRWCKPDL